MALCPGLPRWAGTRRNINSLTYPHYPTFISFFHLLRSTASSLFNLCAWQSFCTTSHQILFGLPLGLEPSISYSIHFFTQSVFSFCSTCPYHHNLFCCSINIISSIPNLFLNSLLGTLFFTLTLHIRLTILISARWIIIKKIFIQKGADIAFKLNAEKLNTPDGEKLAEAPSTPPLMLWSPTVSSKHSRFRSFKFRSRSSSRDEPVLQQSRHQQKKSLYLLHIYSTQQPASHQCVVITNKFTNQVKTR